AEIQAETAHAGPGKARLAATCVECLPFAPFFCHMVSSKHFRSLVVCTAMVKLTAVWPQPPGLTPAGSPANFFIRLDVISDPAIMSFSRTRESEANNRGFFEKVL